MGQRHVQDGRIYEAAPFMVMLPALDAKENVWVYDVTAVPKYDSDPIPTEPVTVTRKVLKVWEEAAQAIEDALEGKPPVVYNAESTELPNDDTKENDTL